VLLKLGDLQLVATTARSYVESKQNQSEHRIEGLRTDFDFASSRIERIRLTHHGRYEIFTRQETPSFIAKRRSPSPLRGSGEMVASDKEQPCVRGYYLLSCVKRNPLVLPHLRRRPMHVSLQRKARAGDLTQSLQRLNDALPVGERPIKPIECLIFEDSIAGVEAGRRAGMRVVWVPHPGLLEAYRGRQHLILAEKIDEKGILDESSTHNEDLERFLPWSKDGMVGLMYEHYGFVSPG
jgi:hypothetical protein